MNDQASFRVVLVSGAICSGKSALVEQLREKHGAMVIKTKDLILRKLPKITIERRSLQRAGEKLDKDDGGQWVAEALQREIDANSQRPTPSGLYVVDCVRIEGQVNAIRRAYGPEVFHIHVKADPKVLKQRYLDRSRADDAVHEYEALKKNRTERNIESLAELADVVVDTGRCSAASVLVRATALLNLYPRGAEKLVDVLIGGQYGSEGKGNIVGHIAPEYDLLVRVGGPNAGHQVFAEPEPEKYFHLPSGTQRAPNAKLLLGPGAVINPTKLLDEIAKHGISSERLVIDRQAIVISSDDIEEEKARFGNISSTAQGVGIASARKLTGRSDYKAGTELFLARDCSDLQPFLGSARKVLADAFVKGHRILLEGTQGTSLSLHHGQYPHVTSRDTTVAGCLADAGIAPSNVRRVIMVCRTYPIRVGGPSGPMEYEVDMEEIHYRSRIPLDPLKNAERTTTTNKERRIAEFDWEQFKDSVQLNGPTDIALTFVDYFGIENRKAFRFEQLTDETIRFVEEVERVSGRPVSLLSTDFNWRNVIDRRSW
ncbi:adenylosuccinate synthetase [Novosphingobium mathurense]|uniref:Adenylosuccinate synthetase n=1 Tax=Novosphingobium mathurense TaxID=428990 RepID=A0A1U6I9L3_9SPHN|nr:adenylosuccinate synthetase [Novosphingobium mathurense]SLK04708.1 adenylosuccinate synthase [Novosphingobium mathurense]